MEWNQNIFYLTGQPLHMPKNTTGFNSGGSQPIKKLLRQKGIIRMFPRLETHQLILFRIKIPSWLPVLVMPWNCCRPQGRKLATLHEYSEDSVQLACN